MPSFRTANAPFDAPDADFILRTSDDVDFRVFRVVLSLASPVFKDMLSLPQPASASASSEPPIVTVSETSAVLEPLLLFCYPALPSTLKSLSDVRLLLEAASKYDLTSVTQEVAAQLVSPRFLESNPLGVYCVACHFGLEAEAKVAAFQTLDSPFFGRPGIDVEELELITIPVYHRLVNYHFECGVAAASVLDRDNWELTEEMTSQLPECEYGEITDESGIPTRLFALLNVLGGLADELRSRPSPTTVALSQYLKDGVENLKDCGCRDCESEIRSGRTLKNLVEVLSRLVGDKLEEASLEFKS